MPLMCPFSPWPGKAACRQTNSTAASRWKRGGSPGIPRETSQNEGNQKGSFGNLYPHLYRQQMPFPGCFAIKPHSWCRLPAHPPFPGERPCLEWCPLLAWAPGLFHPSPTGTRSGSPGCSSAGLMMEPEQHEDVAPGARGAYLPGKGRERLCSSL